MQQILKGKHCKSFNYYHLNKEIDNEMLEQNCAEMVLPVMVVYARSKRKLVCTSSR